MARLSASGFCHDHRSPTTAKQTPETAIHTFTTSLATITGDVNVTIRVVTLEGAPWFVGADVCRALGFEIARHGAEPHIRCVAADERRRVTPGLLRGKGTASLTALSESGLYKLIMRSDKPQARPFQDWVTREVLPSIRKTGAYELPQGAEMPLPGGIKEAFAAHLKALLEILEQSEARAHAAAEEALKKHLSERDTRITKLARELPAVVQPTISGTRADLTILDDVPTKSSALVACDFAEVEKRVLSWSDIVFEKDGVALADSRKVAEVFGKEHKNVLQGIDKMRPDLGEWGGLNFQQGLFYTPLTGDQGYRCFHMTRDGFVLLAMGFTGKAALEFKLQYIQAFNAMEKELQRRIEEDRIKLLAETKAALAASERAKLTAEGQARLPSSATRVDRRTSGAQSWNGRACGLSERMISL